MSAVVSWLASASAAVALASLGLRGPAVRVAAPLVEEDGAVRAEPWFGLVLPAGPGSGRSGPLQGLTQPAGLRQVQSYKLLLQEWHQVLLESL